jgi:hypothetical protein
MKAIPIARLVLSQNFPEVPAATTYMVFSSFIFASHLRI